MAGGVEPIVGYAVAATPEEAVMAVIAPLSFDPDWPDLAAIFEGHLEECSVDENKLYKLIVEEDTRIRPVRGWTDSELQAEGVSREYVAPLDQFGR